MRTPKVYRVFFVAALADVRKHRADYDAEVRDWYENGDGRSRADGGSGYGFPHCIHGRSLWTAYDNICGGCEESPTELQEARWIARERFTRFADRVEWALKAPGDLPYEERQKLMEWAVSLFPSA